MSNILDVFNPKPSKDLSQQEPCLQCLALSSTVLVAGGSYLASGLVFRNPGGKPLPNVTPTWIKSVRTVGAGMVLFGIYRGYEALQEAQRQYGKDDGQI